MCLLIFLYRPSAWRGKINSPYLLCPRAGRSWFSSWTESDKVLRKEVSVVSCHRTKTELPQTVRTAEREEKKAGDRLSALLKAEEAVEETAWAGKLDIKEKRS